MIAFPNHVLKGMQYIECMNQGELRGRWKWKVD